MPRIVYCLSGTARLTGGQKVAVRHVETLVELGMPAVLSVAPGEPKPAFEHAAPFDEAGIGPEDILVIPEDTVGLLRLHAGSPNRKLVFCQNHFYAAAAQNRIPQGVYLDYLACSHTAAAWIARYLPHRSITVLPAFADERRFAPAPAKKPVIVCTPRKRPTEHAALRFMVSRLRAGATHAGALAWGWNAVENASEAEVAKAFAEASIFVSLSRLEGLGMTTLEAMASGCIPVGFTGIGGREYASPTNGIWIAEDDIQALSLQIAATMAEIEAKNPALQVMRQEAQNTAEQWSYRRFREVLAGFWSAELAKPPAP